MAYHNYNLYYTSVIFVDPGVMLTETYYCDLLSQQLLPDIRQVSGELMFQQDSAVPQHTRHASFSDSNISRGGVAKHLRLGVLSLMIVLLHISC